MSSLEQLRGHPQVVQLESALASRRRVKGEDPAARAAAVAILIRLSSTGQPEIFFIKRAVYEGDPWSGQIAFPGGRAEPGDVNLMQTAARETFEETGFDLIADATFIGVLDDLPPQAVRLPRVVVRPFVFLFPDPPEELLSSEVAESFWVPLSILLDRSVWRDTPVSAGGIGMSRFAFHHEGYVVWGMTERILSGLLGLFA